MDEAGDHSPAAPTPAADIAESPSCGGPESEEVSSQYSLIECFECCVCLELVYKPIILVCGHISCFWCVHKAMDGVIDSHCPLCRQPYKYFPAICQLLHNLLQKIDPAAYNNREKEVLEMEEKVECFSPQFVDQITEETAQENGSVHPDSLAVDEHLASKDAKLQEDTVDFILKDLCVSDALCCGCKQLLFRPAGLNCGHVYCQPCVLGLGSKSPRCQICQSVHPGESPKVCTQLSTFLEKRFPKEYALQREAFPGRPDLFCGGKTDQKVDTKKRLVSAEDMSRIHVRVGCDSCGMYPIVGKRYKCKDCKEKIGYDLCELCYSTCSKHAARFNQQHTPDHTFELDESHTFSKLYALAVRGDSDVSSGDSA